MLMLYISCMIIALVLNVFNVAANMGLHAARGIKPFQTNIIVALIALFGLNMISVAVTLYVPGEVSDIAVCGAMIVAIISTWFFVKTCRRLSQEYLSENKNKPVSSVKCWKAGNKEEKEMHHEERVEAFMRTVLPDPEKTGEQLGSWVLSRLGTKRK